MQNDSVVEQDFVATDMDQERGEAAQVGAIGRGQRSMRIGAIEISRGHEVDIGDCDHRVRGSAGLV